MSEDLFSKITDKNIAAYQKRLAEELKLSPATVKRRLSSIRKFCDYAQKEGYLGKKPSLQISSPRPYLGWRSRIVASKVIKLGFSFTLVIILTLLVSRYFFPSLFKMSSNLPLPGQIITQTVATYSPWIVNFRGKLLSPTGEQITEKAQVVFKIYNQEKEGESLWESKTWELEPNPEGEFQAPIGDTTRGDKELPSQLFFQNEKLFLEIEVNNQTLTPRTPLSTAAHVSDALNLGGFPPSQEPEGDTVPVLTSEGNLLLAAPSPKIKSSQGTIVLEGEAVTLTTPTGSEGNITLAPDGSGVLNLIFSGNEGNSINAQNANLSQGALYYGEVASDATGYNLLELASGSTPTTKFSVDSQGNVKAGGNLDLTSGNLKIGGVTRLSSQGQLSSITGYSQDSGIFKIAQGSSDYFQIKKSGLTASVDSATFTLDETGETASGYDTLVLSRKGGTTDAYALYISSGNARLAGNLQVGKSLTVDENLNLKGEATLGDSSTDTITITGNATVSGNLGLGGQLQLGRFNGTPTSMGTGALVYNSSDDLLYYDKDGSWSIVGGGLQEAYNVGNSITTTNARDIQFNLADTATDANFFVDLDGSGSVFAVRDNSNNNLFAVQRNNALINASTRFGTLSIADLVSGGNIGTAATTVDIYTNFNLSQTTSGQTITLPNPTDTTAGRLVYLSNTGTTTFTLYSSTVKVGDTTAAMWDGDSWNLAGGGGLTQGTVNNSTLRWNNTTSQWVENSSFLVDSSGNVTSGTWQGTTIGTQYGGTGQNWSAVTIGALPYFSGTGTMSTLGAGTANYLLMANGATAPSWTNAINGVSIGQTTTAAGSFTTLSSTGVTTLGNDTSTVAIDSSDWDISTSGDMTGIGSITADGTITFSGLSTGVVINSSGVLSSEAQLATTRGGLGADVTAAGAGEILYSTATTTYGHLAAGTSGQTLLSGGSGAPTWGTLGLVYGGTNADLSGVAQGGLIYKAASALAGTGALSGILQGNGSSAPTAITGTANYLPKWSASAPYLTGTSRIYDDGTNIGIGTTNPLALFSVGTTSQFQVDSSGNLTTSGTLTAATTNTLNGLSINSGTITAGTWNGTNIAVQYGGTGQNWSAVAQGALPYFSGTGVMSALGAGTAGYVLQTGGAGANPSWVDISASGGPWTLVGNNLYPDSTSYNVAIGANDAGTAKLYVNGNVGIGTTSPTSLLSVGASSQFQVDSSGDIVKLKNLTYSWPSSHTADGFLKNNGSGTLTWTTIAGAGGVTGSGTAGYIPKWNTSTDLTDSVLYETGGNIGIDTTNPSALFSVGSASQFQVNSSGQVTSGTWQGTAVATQYGGTGQNWSGTLQGNLLYFSGTGVMSVLAPDTAGYVLQTNGASANPSWVDISASGGPWTLVGNNLYPDSTAYNVALGAADAGTAKLYVNGNVGIGTSSPGAALDVNGNLLVQEGGTIDTRAAGSLSIGGTTQIGLTLGRSGATTSLVGSNFTAGGIAYGASNTLSFTSVGTSGQALLSGGAGAPTWGTLGLVYGGTNADLSSVAQGGLIYKGASSLAGTGALTGMLKGNASSAPSAVTGTTDYVTYWSDNNTIAGEQYLATSRGGLGADVTAAGAGEILYSTATTTYNHLAAGTSGQALLSGAAGAPTWGTLGLVYGGTNADLSGVAQGGLIYKGASALAGTGALSGILQGNDSSAPTAITGTANYLPKWSASAPYLTATSTIYDDGNVGIGTTSPGAKLDIAANLSAVGSKIITASNAGVEKFYIDKDGNLYAAGTILSGGGQGMLMTNKSGGTVSNRSLVIIDTTTNSAFTTTTTPYSKNVFGVVTGVGLGVTNDADSDGVCDANDICMVAVGGEVEVTTKNASTASKGDYLYTSDTASSAVASAKQFDGLIGVVSNTAGAASGYLKMIFKVQPQVTAAASIDKGSKHNEYWLYANEYLGVGEGSDVNANLLSRGLSFDNLLDTTKTDSANTTVGGPTQVSSTTGSPTPAAPFRTGLMNGQTYSTATTDNAGNTYLGSNTVNKVFYYDRTKDSTPATLVNLGIDPNWYNGSTLSVATSSATFSQNDTNYSQTVNPNLSTTYNGSALKVTGTYATAAAARTIYITIKSPTTFDWTDYNGNSATGTTITPGTAQTLTGTGVSVTFTNARYNTGDVFKIASWFVEPSGTTRGTKAQFPERSNIIATASSVDIIDADTQKLWMRFSQGTNYALGVDANNDPSSANALNGKLYISTNGSAATGLYTFDFSHDVVFRQNATDWRLSDQPIAQRNGTNTYNVLNTSNILVNITANDVSAAVIPNQPTQTVTVSGWGYFSLSSASETVNLPYKFNDNPRIVITSAGHSSTTAPVNLASCSNASAKTVVADTITTTNFIARESAADATNYQCYSWTATGQVSPRQYVAVGTAGGISLINETDQTVASGTDTGASYNNVCKIQLTSDSKIYPLVTPYGTCGTGDTRVWPIKDVASKSSLSGSYYASYFDYNGLGGIPSINGSAMNSLYVTTGTSTIDGISNSIYVGSTAGVTVIQEKQSGMNVLSGKQSTGEKNGSVKYYTKDYISEEMVGDIRGMWPLSANGAISMSDASVKADTLTNNGTATFVTGVRGGGVSLNGTTQYLSCTDASCGGTSKLDGDGSTVWTISAWIKPINLPSTGTQANIIYKPGDGANNGYQLSLMNSGGTYYVRLASYANNSDYAYTVPTAAWTYIVGVYESSTSRKLYINGILAQTFSGSSMLPGNTANPFYIGSNGGSDSFNGTIDEPFVTANALTAGQIKHMYEVGYRALQGHATTLGGGGADLNQQLGFISTGTNTVGAVGVDYNNQFMYVGTNSTTLGAVSKIDLNSDTNIKTYNSSANVPTGGTLLVDEDTKSLAVGYNLEAVGSAASGVKSMAPDNNSNGTSGNFISKTLTTAESFTQAYIWSQHVVDSSDSSNSVTVWASNDGGSNYYQCNLTNTDTSQTPTEYEYFCQFNTAGSSLKIKEVFARGSTKTNTYLTRYGIAWIGSDAVGGAPGGNGLYTNNNASVADGSYVEVAHNQNTSDLVTNGWRYNTNTSKWEQIDISTNNQATNSAQVNYNTEANYTQENMAYSVTLTPSATTGDITLTLGSGTWNADARVKAGVRVVGNGGVATITGTPAAQTTITATVDTAFTNTNAIASGSWSMYGTTFDGSVAKINSAPPDSYTKLLLHADGTDASTTFTDSSSSPKTVTANGNAQIDTAQSKFGGASGLFDGTGDYLSSADSPDWDFSTGDWTVDFWVRRDGDIQGYSAVVSTLNDFTSLIGWNIGFAAGADLNKLRLYSNASGSGQADIIANTIIPNTTWTHVAVVRNGNTVTMYQGGVSVGSRNVTGYNYVDSSTGLVVGRAGTSFTSYGFNGWADEIRVSKGIARWTAAFTAPTSAYAPAPTSQYYSVVVNTDQLNTQSWAHVDSVAVTETLNSQTINYAVSFDNRTTFSIYDSTTSNNGWRPIARNNSGTWQYNSNTSAGVSNVTWTNATYNSQNGAISQAAGVTQNQMTGTQLSAVTALQWREINGFTATTATLDFAAALKTTDGSQIPQVDQIKVNYTQAGSKIVQVDANTVRLYNYSGSTQNLRLDVITGGLGRNAGTVSLAPLAADVDSQDNLNSIWINKTGSDGNLLKLQTSGSDQLLLSSTGNLGIEGNLYNISGDTLTINDNLSVAGIADFTSSGVTILGDNFVYAARFVDTANNDYFVDPASSGTSAAFYGNVGIGTTSPQGILNIAYTGLDSYTKLLLHSDGTDGSTTFIDETEKAVTAVGNAQIDTAQSKFGGASGLFDGTGDYLSTPDSADWYFGTGDFTIDFWVRFSSLPTSGNYVRFFTQASNTTNLTSIFIYNSGSSYDLYLNVAVSDVPILQFARAVTVSTNTWYHIALTRNGSNFRLFWNGTQLGDTYVDSDSYPDFTGNVEIGGTIVLTSPGWLNGWIDEFRISKGIARWTANFTPPTSAYSPALTNSGFVVTSSGKVGIGTTTPDSKMQVTGGGLCVGSDANCNTDNNTEGVVYSSSTAMTTYDVAENYPTKDETLKAGEVVSVDQNNEVFVERSTSAYNQNLLGIISTEPGVLLGGFAAKDYLDEIKVPVALAGRVPVKIASSSAEIKVGDFLTSSDEPGKAMKAEKAGITIGKALENWAPSRPSSAEGSGGASKIMVFVNLGWHDPDVYLTSTGDLHIQEATYSGLLADNNDNSPSIFKLINQKTGEAIEKIGAFADLIAANIKAGRVETQELISPLAEIEEIKTNRISLSEITSSSESGDIVINLENQNSTESAFGKLIVKGKEGQAVASIDAEGNATFAGTLTANEATIAGTLFADEIITRHGKFGDLLAATISTEASPSAVMSEEEINNLINEILASAPEATSPAVLAENISIPSSVPNLNVLGTASLADTTIAGSLNIGGTLSLADSSINTLYGPLYLQSLGLGGIDILAGKIVIDKHGNATFEGDLTVKGRLAANTISPLPENDLVIDLAQIPVGPEVTQSAFGKLLVKGLDGQTVAFIDASGSARFAEVATQKLIIASDTDVIPNEGSSSEITTNATAGKATLPAGETEITIKSPFVTENTLIYVTPISDTQNKVLFVKAKKAAGSTNELGWFKVGIDVPINSAIEFNWWLIN